MDDKIEVSNVHLSVIKFSTTPFGRYREDGSGNGETYRKEYLLPVLKSGASVIVDLDGTEQGYGSSFLVEAFANLIRKEGYSLKEIKERITFKSEDSDLLEEIDYYLKEASEE